MKLDYRSIESAMDTLWVRWDSNGDGELTFQEFTNNVLPYLIDHFKKCSEERIPNINNAQKWFAYFDEDNSGELSQAEVVRAIIKTFKLSDTTLSEINNIRNIVENIWVRVYFI